jgi:hypothetical protein
MPLAYQEITAEAINRPLEDGEHVKLISCDFANVRCPAKILIHYMVENGQIGELKAMRGLNFEGCVGKER